jgi:thioredoxin-like negative regulator of GroEL
LIEILHFTANASEPCRQLSPILEEVGKEQSDVRVTKIDVEDPKNSEIIRSLGIRAVPTLIFKQPEGKPIHRMTGLRKDTKRAINDVLQLIREKKLPNQELEEARSQLVDALKPLATETPIGQLVELMYRTTYEAKTKKEFDDFIRDCLVYLDMNTEQLQKLKEVLEKFYYKK